MQHSDAMRAALEEVDVARVRRLHAAEFPHLPPLGSDEQVTVSIHMARTSSTSVDFRSRAWSHRWLTERGYPSQLPDADRPKAERIYPTVATATGVSINVKSKWLLPLRSVVQAAVEEVILDEYSGRVERIDHDKLRGRIIESKDATMRRELGRLSGW